MRLLVLLVALSAGAVYAGDDRDERLETLDDLSSRLNRYSTDDLKTRERDFLHERVTDLLRSARGAIDDEYRFGRLAAAIDDFLDASEQIEDAYEEEPKRSDTRMRAARELEDTYFDLKQGEYFAAQTGERAANDYVKTGRRLYQAARAAYEEQAYARARDLGEAAREVVAGLESLAQAAVRIPTPPKL